jgi:hypothetical protein
MVKRTAARQERFKISHECGGIYWGTPIRGVDQVPRQGQSPGQDPFGKPICKRDAVRQAEAGRRAPPRATTADAADVVRAHVGDRPRRRKHMSDVS